MAIVDLKLRRFGKAALFAMFALAIGATASASAQLPYSNTLNTTFENSNSNVPSVMIIENLSKNHKPVCSPAGAPDPSQHINLFSTGPDLIAGNFYTIIGMASSNCRSGTQIAGMSQQLYVTRTGYAQHRYIHITGSSIYVTTDF